MGALLSVRCPGDHLEYLLARQRVLLPKTLISLTPEIHYHLVDCVPPTVIPLALVPLRGKPRPLLATSDLLVTILTLSFLSPSLGVCTCVFSLSVLFFISAFLSLLLL